MRILVCHNYYAVRSGECTAVDGQIRLLRDAGHEVTLLAYDNAEIVSRSLAGRVRDAVRALWSRATVSDVERLLRRQRFDVAYVHNTWPRMSPSVYASLSRRGVAVAAAVYNFRLLCPAGTLYRDGAVCRDCIDRPGGLVHAVAHRCYRGSLAASLTAAASTLVNRDVLRIMHRHVDAFAVQTAFVRDLLAANGLPAERLKVVGSAFFGRPAVAAAAGDHLLFAGRLEDAKGVRTLLAAAALSGFSVRILGDGPLARAVAGAAADPAMQGRVSYLGRVGAEAVLAEIAASAAVVVPSQWYESYPNVICEAMAHSRPVIAARLGSLPEIVRDGENGLLFEPGDARSLAACIERLLRDPALRARLAVGAAACHAAEMSPRRLAERLTEVLEAARAHRQDRAGRQRRSGRRAGAPPPDRSPRET